MKRRNADCSKLRRPLKRNRITEGIYGSTFLYLKFLVVWALVLLADFVLEFRFEYLWPFWLFIRSVYDSFRYQGLAFSVFFVCVAFTSDIICLLFIPVQWLFFAASTYVWVQYVWHTERGVCLPTVSLWILFVYIEAAIRFKDLKNFHVDLCRPFAAHCIGYPVVTLGFGFKSYSNRCSRGKSEKQKKVKHTDRIATNGSVPSAPSSSSATGKNEKKHKLAVGKGTSGGSHRDPTDNCIPNNQLSKPEALVRLEQDVKKLKADLQASRQVEQDLRSQIGSLGSAERSIRTELSQLRQENELLQNKLHNAVQAKQKDKQSVGQLEKRLKAEQEARAAAEKQLADEKKRKKGECTDTLRRRINELETECKKLSMDIKLKEDQIRELDLKVQELHKYKENEKDTEVLMSALSAMQDKTQHLENSLSAETRIKLDLFSALGDAKRQLEIAQAQILQKDQEIKDLKQKIAEVMAVMPSISYSSDNSSMTPVAPHYSSKFMDTNPSGLDPNASVYQPLKK
ncbi:Macoilin-2 [Dissostichus eleginoides]|uniref:Macoilin-2 n=1 Tax=Dissostichus eleginoides TaxID=100907 RepID=A0AAD9C4D6_DISEL|nr:Macoilin-2 [Dissostichus eleginoides]